MSVFSLFLEPSKNLYMKNFRFLTAIFLSLFAGIMPALSQNWPCFRGPNGDGTSPEKNVPLKWDSVTDVLWKVSVPGSGYSSPVVWGDRLFLTTAFVDKQEKALLCYDTKSGKLLWQQIILKTPFEGKHDNNGYASGTPATDGSKIYVSFLDGKDAVVAAYDFSGKQVWVQRPGTFFSPHGYSCSPVLFEDKVIINGDSQKDSFVAAMSKSTGKVIWKVSHERQAHSFSTPIIRKIAGKNQLIFLGNREIASYDPATGKKYWFVNGPSEDFCSSPVYNSKSGLVLVSSAWPVRSLVAVKPDGSGDVTKTHVFFPQNLACCHFNTMHLSGLHCREKVIIGCNR